MPGELRYRGVMADGRPCRAIGRELPCSGPMAMGFFAWRNLLTRPLRTILALIGLSVPILGVMGFFSVSNGLATSLARP